MTPQVGMDSEEIGLPTLSVWEQSEWIRRCRVEINAKDPLLSADDVLSLAADLWEREDCQLATPELAVGLLFTDQLRCLSCASHLHADFSVLCSSARTGRCPTRRLALRCSRTSTGSQSPLLQALRQTDRRGSRVKRAPFSFGRTGRGRKAALNGFLMGQPPGESLHIDIKKLGCTDIARPMS